MVPNRPELTTTGKTLTNTLFVLEMALIGFAEHRRYQDWSKPGSMGKQYFLGLEKGLGGSGDPAYPGGPFFNPLGFGKDEKSMKELKLKEIKGLFGTYL